MQQLIAIVGRDHQLHAVNIDADNPQLLPLTPPEQRCAWPTWSPNAAHLTYSVYPAAGSNGQGAFRLIRKRVACGFDIQQNGESRTLYVNEPGSNPIAHDTPHYTMWSPDGKKVAFVAQRRNAGLCLSVSNPADGSAQPHRILDGAPMYFCWTRDSQQIVAHTHQLHYLINLNDDDITPAQVPVVSLGYMAPSASPTDDTVAICGAISDTQQGILLANTNEGGAEIAAEMSGAIGFSWSPNGSHLAVASRLDRASGCYGQLGMLDIEAGGHPKAALRPLLDEPLLCFFWSPDGTKIAYITPSENANGSVRWGVLDIDSGERRYLADFRPSREQLTMFMFFDQYAQSHRVWSSDSQRLLFAGVPGWQQTRVPLPDANVCGVYMADTLGSGSASLVGEGSLGVWSP